MGCAYGIATQAALERGATVHACDMERGSRRNPEQEMPAQLRARLTTSVGILPGVEFPDRSFGAILCSRVLHFPPWSRDSDTARKMHRWLQPGGRLFLVADTPYSGFWFSGAPAYEQRKATGEEWPGLIEDISGLHEGWAPAGRDAAVSQSAGPRHPCAGMLPRWIHGGGSRIHGPRRPIVTRRQHAGRHCDQARHQTALTGRHG